MLVLLNLFFNICRLRANPQDIPSSTFLMVLALLSYGLFSLLISIIEIPIGNAILSSSVDTLLLMGLAIVSLWIRNLPERKTQTITALAGTGTLLQLVAWPILFWLSQDNDTLSEFSLLRWILLILVFWNVVVIAHILRHALSVTYTIGAGIALLYVYLSIRIADILFIAAS